MKSNLLVPLSDINIDNAIKKQISYGAIPLSLLLNKASEVFLTDRDRTIPLNVIDSGTLFGLFETMDFLFNRHCEKFITHSKWLYTWILPGK